MAESFSSHPISKSLREACGELDTRRATDAQEIAGHGVRTMVDGHVVLAGNARMMDDSKITYTKIPAPVLWFMWRVTASSLALF